MAKDGPLADPLLRTYEYFGNIGHEDVWIPMEYRTWESTSASEIWDLMIYEYLWNIDLKKV